MENLQSPSVGDDDGASALMGLSFGQIFVEMKQMEIRHIKSMTKITKLSSHLQESRTRIEDLDNEILTYQSREKEHTVEVERLVKRLNDSQKREEESDEMIKELSERLDDLQTREEKHSADREDLSRRLRDSEASMEARAVESDDLKRSLKESRIREEEAVKELDELKCTMMNYQAREEESEKKIDNLSRQLHLSQGRDEEYEAKLEDIDRQMCDTLARLEKRDLTIEDLNDKLGEYQSREEKAVCELADLQKKLQGLGDGEQTIDIEQQLHESRERERESLNKVKDLEIKLSESKASEEEISLRYTELNDQLQKRCAMIIKATEISTSDTIHSSPNKEGTGTANACTKTQQDFDSSDTQVFRMQLQESEDKLCDMEQQNQVVKGQVLELRSQLIHTQLMTKLHEERESELGKELADCKKHVEFLEVKVVELRIELEERNESLEKSHSDLATAKSELAIYKSMEDGQASGSSGKIRQADDEVNNSSVVDKLASEPNNVERTLAPEPTPRRFFNFMRSNSAPAPSTIVDAKKETTSTQRRADASNGGVGAIEPVHAPGKDASENRKKDEHQASNSSEYTVNGSKGKETDEENRKKSPVGFFTFGKNASNLSQKKAADDQSQLASTPEASSTKASTPSSAQAPQEAPVVPPQSSFPKVTWKELADEYSSDDTSDASVEQDRDETLKHALQPLQPSPSPLSGAPIVSPTEEAKTTHTSLADNDDSSPVTLGSKDKNLSISTTCTIKSKDVPSLTAVTPDGSIPSQSPKDKSPTETATAQSETPGWKSMLYTI